MLIETNITISCKKSNYTSIKQQLSLWKKVGELLKEGDWLGYMKTNLNIIIFLSLNRNLIKLNL